MLKKHLIFIFILSFAFSACQKPLPEKTSENYSGAIKSFYVGLAALQVGDDQKALEELTKTVNLADGEPAAWNNLGVLQLRQKDYENAAKSLEKAKTLAPDNGRIYLNLATLETSRGNFDKTSEYLNKAIELEPENVQAIFALANEKERQTDDAEALKLYEKIAQTKPENLAVKLEIARLSAKLNNAEPLKNTITEIEKSAENFSAEAKEQFDTLKTSAASGNIRQAVTQVSYLRNVLLREPAFRSSLAEIKPSDTTLGEVFTKPLKLPAPDFSPAEPDLELNFSSETVKSVTGNPSKWFLIFLDGEKKDFIYSNEEKTFIGQNEIPIQMKNYKNFCSFDFDYDFKNDVAFATEKGFRLFKQTDSGNFEDVTNKTKLSGEILNNSYSGVWTLDVDNEGDLDLLLAPQNDLPIVLQNNSDGSFTTISPFKNLGAISDFIYADLDEDGDSDAVFLEKVSSGNDEDLVKTKLKFFVNNRGGLFNEIKLPDFGDIAAINVSEINGDGKLDLLVLQKNGNFLRFSLKENGTDWEQADLFKETDDLKDSEVKTGDYDNNGANDVILSKPSTKTSAVFLNDKNGQFKKLNKEIAGITENSVDLDGDGKLDLIGVDAEGKPTIFQNNSAKNYHWQILKPKASKTEGDQRINSFGIGGEMEIRAGLLTQKQIINSPQVHFGLGENTSADVLRVVWGNGYVQAEFDLQTNQIVAAEQRLKGSCPHLFAWNGLKFALVKDAPPWSPALGLKINAQDTYGILQTEEWFKIPGEALQPKDGFYELRITGEYWESFYLDNYKLVAVDHPEGTEIFTDERFAIPLPPLKVFTTEMTHQFASAKSDKGEDVAEIVKNLDEKYLDGFERGKFQGVAKEHFVELELPENAPRDKKIWIVGDGFVHPTDASINVQRGQIPDVEMPKSLSLEVRQENGEWKTVKENLGFPAGKMKTVLIDLPENARKIRLRTELEIFWDKLAWAVNLSENRTRETSLDLASANLRYRGFSVIEKADDSSPEKPIYNKILTTGQRWRDLEGFYTRFGDVLELLKNTDDRFVLANAGDEIILKFKALPEVEKGWKRDFVIIGNGWIKDGDLNSVFSKTLLPLPTHATNDYSTPPTTLENDPVYQKHREDWIKFHTRYVAPDDFRNALRK